MRPLLGTGSLPAGLPSESGQTAVKQAGSRAGHAGHPSRPGFSHIRILMIYRNEGIIVIFTCTYLNIKLNLQTYNVIT